MYKVPSATPNMLKKQISLQEKSSEGIEMSNHESIKNIASSFDTSSLSPSRKKRSMKRLPSLSSNSMGFFEVPSNKIADLSTLQEKQKEATQMTIMKRRTEENASYFANERYEILNQLFPSRVEAYRSTSHINRKGSFSMGPLLPHGRRNTEDMEDELKEAREDEERIRSSMSYRRIANVCRYYYYRLDIIDY